MWHRAYSRLTTHPLLDTPRLHSALWSVSFRQTGSGAPPPPFEQLARWASAHLRAQRCSLLGKVQGTGSSVILNWLYERAHEPYKVLHHLTGTGGICPHKGRAHAHAGLRVTTDLVCGTAFLRCWDQSCVEKLPGGGFIKAKRVLGKVPSACLVVEAQRAGFESQRSMHVK